MSAVQFHVPGKPVAWARAGKNGKVSFTLAPQRAYGELVKVAAREAMAGRAPFAGAVALACEFVFPIAKSWALKKKRAALAGDIFPIAKPDWDNCGKIVSDALNAIAWRDDAQVADGRVTKRYGERAGCWVTVTPYGEVA